MDDALAARLRSAGIGEVRCNEPLARHTTWRVGGPADYYLLPANRDALRQALAILAAAGVPHLPLGRGSNLLVRDGGIRGAVIDMRRIAGITMQDDGLVVAEGGAVLMTLIRTALAGRLGGLERLAGIPGSVGGATVMNAGAGGSAFGDHLVTVELDGPDGTTRWPRERCGFGYRTSAFPPGAVVAAVTLQLARGERQELEETVTARLAERRRHQAVGGPNAGSVFRNPVGQSAWQLIAAAGLRGRRVGQAAVAEQHCNFIVNCGGATSRDIEELMVQVRDEVLRHSGVTLLPEVKIVGEA